MTLVGDTLELDRPDDPGRPVADQPRRIFPGDSATDRTFVTGARVIAFVTLVIVSAIGIFLGLQLPPTIHRYGWSFLTRAEYSPNENILGIGACLVGTVEIATIALIIAFPLAFLTALFISDWAPPGLRPLLVRVVDMMAAVPSIVFGLWGLLLIQPHATHVAKWLAKYFGWVPFLHVHTDVDEPVWSSLNGFEAYAGSAFIAAIAVSMMVFPMATSVMREVFSQAPIGEKEAALALGGTRWAMVRHVVIPFGRSGIIGGTMLALGRALGETISVVIILNHVFKIKWNVLESGAETVSSLIAIQSKEATPDQLSALLAAGFVLFCMTLVVNTVAASVVARGRSGSGTDL